MNNRVNEIRKVIKALRVSMMEAESVMREQITRDQDCTFVAEELLKMRSVMAGLVREKEALGDHAPILVNSRFTPRPVPKPLFVHPVKRHLVPAQSAG
ncbi:MAG: hypothetical protein GY844_02220 [Bradyrhizobium sp.]|nr:hypothetical protein [Bradyrhizobium sp.]